MNMARSTFYKRPHAGHRAAREKADTDLRVRIEDILAEFPAYGYRRVTHELRRRGLVINHKRVARVMREHALTPHRVRAWLATTNSDHKQPIYPNLRSSITPEGPDELWVADLTYIRLTTGFVFLAVVLDAWSRRVIGYAISHLLDTRLCLAALDAALDLRQPRAGLVHHSDRGVQGGFKRSSQHLKKEEELRWRQASADGRIELYVRRCVHPVVPRWDAGSIGRGSGRKSLEGCRARSRRWQPACLPLLARAGFANVVACHLSVFVLCRGATYRSSSEKRLRFFMLAVAACARSPGSWAAHRRRSRENCGGTQQHEVETSSIEPRAAQWHADRRAKTSESCQTRCKQRTEAVCAGSPWRPDRGSRRGGRAGPQFTLGRASPWSPTRPAVGGLVESRADRQQATGRLSR